MAAEFVGGALVSSFLQAVFEKLLTSGQVVDYFRTRRLNETLLDKLGIKLLSLNSVLDDAEAKHIKNPHVKSWLEKLKNILFDAEDLLDEINTEASKNKLEAEFHTTTSSKVWNFFSAAISSFDKEIESRMKELLDNLQVLANEKDMLGLKEGGDIGVGLGKKSSQRLSTSLVDETVVYGRHDDKQDIIDMLLSNNESGGGDSDNLSIVSIVGMGGMGKTTLAQLVYNDDRVEEEFDLKAWVCVSEKFDVTRVSRAVLEAITLCPDDTKDINMLQVKLREKLSRKRFLIVLDDVWNENYLLWEAFRTPFIYGAQGSKIIVTTRSDRVASTMRVAKLHHLKQLAEEDSWLLFAKHAFREEDRHSNAGLEEIGRKIIKKCKRLPLALKTVGSLLYTKLSFEEWNSVLRSDIWEMSDNDNNIIPALRLSYEYLSSHLKRCFAYCSLFPKDYEFDKEHLIRLWMAENFLGCDEQNRSMKELGDQFFQDLLSRSFFQRSGGDGMRFVMHDLINDLAKHVSGGFCFRLDAEKAPHISRLTRHFSYLRRVNEYSKRFEAIYSANRLRTFIPLSMHHGGRIVRRMPGNMIHELLSKLRCLRVLSLSGYFNILELPDSIGNLKHLRYLDLSGTGIKELPNSLCLLYNLQTLKLRHCEHLLELPSDMHKLVNLHHLDIRGTKLRMLPMGLGKLKKLQVLTSFFVGKSGESNINQLAELNLRSTLSISELQNVVRPMDALAANLRNKIHLEGLMLKWSKNDDGSQNERDVLEMLQPHTNLKYLCIENYGGTRFPSWLEDNSLSNVVSLELSNCKYCFSLPALGFLPSLKELLITGLDGIASIGAEFYSNNSFIAAFRTLQVLKIQEMMELEEWECENAVAGKGAFPCLKELQIKNCPKLKKQLPQQLPSLVKLAIHNCQKLTASLPHALAISYLVLKNCGNLQWETPASTLKYLEIEGLSMERSLLQIIEHTISSTSLESFVVRGCPNMEFPIHHSHTFLGTVFIDGSYESLKTFPLDFLPQLQVLSLKNCSNLERFSVSDGNHLSLTSLKSLEICGCPKFVSLPREFSAPKMEVCLVECMESLKSLSEGMNTTFPSLRHMELHGCPQLESFPVGGLPSNLKKLHISNCPKLVASRMKWDLKNHASLSFFRVEDVNIESFPQQGLLPQTLASLTLYRCSNLKALDYKALCHLPSLKELKIGHCPRLQCLPKEGLPSFISTFNIWGDCGSLTWRCQKEKGEDWSKIAQIPCILIGDDIIT